MSKRDGFDITVGGEKVGSFQTRMKDDGMRDIFVVGAAIGSGLKLHFGARVVENVIGKSFARASNYSGSDKVHAEPGVNRNERSTEALATFVVEEQSRGGPKVLRFVQGEYETAPVVTAKVKALSKVMQLPWPDDCRRAEYGLSLYDTRSHLSTGTTQTTIAYSSNSTGFGVAITLRHSERWN
jgi:hypothetical protein